MKFLVISRPNGQGHGLNATADTGAQVKALVEDPKSPIEKAYAVISGGSIIVINAKDTVELATIVRSNPLFKASFTEIIPIADAHDFLTAFAAKK
ncbi:hypothetical protein [Flavobacterium collinsii]|uniref:YCII-related domain-containing protein n=1 Tax=Flavobacterium collinsii TaxID=1114861 RepID=A0ABM8KP73_9FLAO|nr:hypothetical protein [Flavobacterium collinsii]CAA9202065.1 hypothetical protein FLACOL7796_04082 [Flavobacterium collinsii]